MSECACKVGGVIFGTYRHHVRALWGHTVSGFFDISQACALVAKVTSAGLFVWARFQN